MQTDSKSALQSDWLSPHEVTTTGAHAWLRSLWEPLSPKISELSPMGLLCVTGALVTWLPPKAPPLITITAAAGAREGTLRPR